VWLSGKPLELGLAPPKGQGSWQTGGCICLVPGWCLSQQGWAPVVPHGAGARQVLIGGCSPRVRGSVIPGIAVVQEGLKSSGLGSGGLGIPAICGIISRLGSGADG
jgi:hypothetical protein